MGPPAGTILPYTEVALILIIGLALAYCLIEAILRLMIRANGYKLQPQGKGSLFERCANLFLMRKD